MVGGENSRPEAKAGIVADFDIGEAEVEGFAEEGGAVGGAVGVPGRKRRARPKRAATPKIRSRRMERVARAFC